MNQDSSSSDPLQAAWNFGKLMPGFGFLEQWTKGASAAMPAMGQWVAPTLDPEELDKRIQDLRTVQFWLEQNSRMIAMTIQALEVQRMTLATLKSMNVSADALRDSLQARGDESSTGSDDAAAAPQQDPQAATGSAAQEAAGGPADAASAAVDPMRWWGALTQQFTELATRAASVQPVRAQPAAQAGAKAAARASSKAAAKTAPHAAAKTTAKATTASAARRPRRPAAGGK